MLEGSGKIVTYTIITVPPDGFEKYVPYAWVVLKLDGSDLRVSGFMDSIKTPSDLPIATESQIVAFDDRGIIVEIKRYFLPNIWEIFNILTIFCMSVDIMWQIWGKNTPRSSNPTI